MRAVGTDQKARCDRPAIAQRNVDRVLAGCETRDLAGVQVDAERLRLFHQRVHEVPVLDHVRERLALFDIAAEGKKCGPHGVIELRIRDDHVEDRLRIRRDRIPDLDRFEQAPRRGGDGRSARVFRLGMRQRGIDDRHRKRIAEALTQRDRQREAGEAGAADDDLGVRDACGACHGHGHSL